LDKSCENLSQSVIFNFFLNRSLESRHFATIQIKLGFRNWRKSINCAYRAHVAHPFLACSSIALMRETDEQGASQFFCILHFFRSHEISVRFLQTGGTFYIIKLLRYPNHLFKIITYTVVRGCPQKTSAVREGGGLSSADILRAKGKEGFFRCGRPHFLAKKLRNFLIYGASALRTDKRGGGLNKCGHFLDKE